MSSAPSGSPTRLPLRLPYAVLGWSIALVMIVAQGFGAKRALSTHAALDALQFVVLLPLTLSWCFIMSLFLPATFKRALAPFISKMPGVGTAIWVYAMFAMFVMNYKFK